MASKGKWRALSAWLIGRAARVDRDSERAAACDVAVMTPLMMPSRRSVVVRAPGLEPGQRFRAEGF
jgi:hypothetical protein